MYKLNLPEYQQKLRKNNLRNEIYDPFRKKYIALTPEEWVRQNFLQYLINEKSFPASLVKVEKGLKVNNLAKRFDIVIYDATAQPRLLVECKAPEIKISQDTFDQAARYNLSLGVDYLIITNGMNHYCCKINFTSKSIEFLNDIPNYQQLNLKNG